MKLLKIDITDELCDLTLKLDRERKLITQSGKVLRMYRLDNHILDVYGIEVRIDIMMDVYYNTVGDKLVESERFMFSFNMVPYTPEGEEVTDLYIVYDEDQVMKKLKLESRL